MELNNITNTGTWGQQVTRLNDNFNKVALGIDTLQEMYESLSQSAIEVVDTLPQTGAANKIYRLVGATSYSDYMYNADDLNTPILMATYDNAIDDEPTAGSDNLVKSGGVKGVLNELGFYVEDAEWVRVVTDSEWKILAGIKADGSVEWVGGVPTPVKEYIKEYADEHGGDMSGKVDQSEYDQKMSEIDEEIEELQQAESSVEYKESIEYSDAKTDSEYKFLEGIRMDGVKEINGDLVVRGKVYAEKLIEDEKLDNVGSVITFNNPAEMTVKLQMLCAKDKGVDVKPLNILHFSDIHEEKNELQRVMAFYRKYHYYIDDILHTGDNVAEQYDTGSFDFWGEVEGAEKILNVIGNHDGAKSGSPIDWNYYCGQLCYERYFAPYIQNWGVTYTPNVCYYYKDYQQQKVRLIVLDDNISEDYSAENTWLQGVLNDARTNNLSVVIATHTPKGYGIATKVNKPNTAERCSFSNGSLNASAMYRYADACTLVESFITAGGKFVCWLCGHSHKMDMGFSVDFPNQLQVCADIAYAKRTDEDVLREPFNNSEDSFNVVSIDTENGLLKLVHVGTTYDKFLRRRDTLCYDYVNKVLVSDNGESFM